MGDDEPSAARAVGDYRAVAGVAHVQRQGPGQAGRAWAGWRGASRDQHGRQQDTKYREFLSLCTQAALPKRGALLVTCGGRGHRTFTGKTLTPWGEKSRALVVALLPHPRARVRVTTALRGRAEVRFCESDEDLRQLAFGPGVSAVIAAPTDGTGRSTSAVVSAIREGCPSLPVIAYCTVRDSLPHEIVDLVRAGVDDLILIDVDDSVHRIRGTLVRARTARTAAWAMAEIAPLVPNEVAPIVNYCLANAPSAPTVEGVADVHGINRKTLRNRFVHAGLPAPSAIIAWCRLLVAAELLEDRGRPLESIAHELNFPTAGALRAMLTRYMRLRPQEVRENGGPRCVLSALRAALRTKRQDPRKSLATRSSTLAPATPDESAQHRRRRADRAVQYPRHPLPDA